jgi:hypothetical protein
MALAFGKTNGSAIKNSHESFEYKDGENTLRMVGGILPRYIYWIKGTNDKQIPVECLAFDREAEKFNNAEVDHVPEYYPDVKCGWAYTINCIDPKDGKVKVLHLKKKLFSAICSAAEDLELDPTDPDNGFDIVFKRAKTGPLAYNVEYTLSVLKLKKRPLTDVEREEVSAALTIDAKFVRQTPVEIKALLDKIAKGVPEEAAAGTDQEAVNELG